MAQAAAALALGAAMAGADVRYAVRYDPGSMERVSANRNMPIVGCMLAHPTLDLGVWVLVEGAQTGVRRRCRVTDTSQPQDKARHIRTRLIELDDASARAICPRGWQGKRSECKVLVR